MGTVLPWREKQLVLCFYAYVSRMGGSTRTLTDGVMVQVEFEDQIEGAFNAAMWQKRAKWNLYSVGPRPDDWQLAGYVSRDGKWRKQFGRKARRSS